MRQGDCSPCSMQNQKFAEGVVNTTCYYVIIVTARARLNAVESSRFRSSSGQAVRSISAVVPHSLPKCQNNVFGDWKSKLVPARARLA
jgi:hypothetical protein